MYPNRTTPLSLPQNQHRSTEGLTPCFSDSRSFPIICLRRILRIVSPTVHTVHEHTGCRDTLRQDRSTHKNASECPCTQRTSLAGSHRNAHNRNQTTSTLVAG